ncbi:hypothetical protein RUM44_003511 [Polyplax serrata]|uniref:Nephrin n=1 Tax=Polyplax serrata TaxID=468196 RepID=A0ABR1AGU8_POLSC
MAERPKTTLKVTKVAPAHVTISGATEAKAGEKVFLTCTTDNSNPPADIKWMVGGRQVRNTSVITMPSPDGGSVSTSNITVSVGQNRRSVVVICHGLNMHLTENIVGTHTINVLYPPGHPIISGYTRGTNIPVGTVQMISCISSGGNPLATLTWYKNDKKITSVSKTNDRSVSAEITVYTNMTDNGAIYKCEASNPATEVPFIETVKLNVYFPPDHVRVRKEPAELKPGQVATLTCESSSSNPPAKLSWWKEGIPVGGAVNSTKPGLHGGVISIIELKVNVTPEINGVVYTCQATNEPLQRSVHDAFTLDVLYKPVFKALPVSTYSAIEGESLLVLLETKGNPSNMVYSWSKNGGSFSKKNSRIFVDGPMLNITRLNRHDSGEYKCTAFNSQGSAHVTFNISVQYPAHVVSVPRYVIASPGESVELNCTVDGNPLREGHVSWRNKNFEDFDERTTKSFMNSTSYLVVRAARKKDVGPFDCVVNNGVGNETFKTVQLLVKYKPEMDSSPARIKAASNIGSTGRLICRTSSVPKPTFVWFRNGAIISVNTTSKYLSEFHEIDLTTFESILLIDNVEATDYGKYECEAQNEEGTSKSTIVLNVTSAPDVPLSLSVLNVTHDSVTISWVPGFDGGLRTSYRIRYRPEHTNSEKEGYRYLDVMTENATSFTVTGLDLDTEYVFTLMAFNERGSSNYMHDVVRTRTSSTPPPSLHSPPLGSLGENEFSMKMVVITAVAGITMLALNILVVDVMLPEELLGKADIPRIIIISVSITGVILLLFNVLLVACFILRKKNKKVKKGPSEQGSNKSATIEMYAPSSYNETVTGETLSSVSEKSENYSNGEVNADYAEDGCKVATSTYLIDQFDYPFQYPASYEMQHQMRANHVVQDPEIVPARNTLPHPVSKGNYISNSVLPPPTIEGAYYNMQPDSRYLPYSQTLEYNHTLPTGNGSLKRQRGPVLPDVTVLHNNSSPPKMSGPVLSATLMPQPALSTFGQTYPPNLENEGHLV